MVRPTINSEKHYFARSLTTIADNTVLNYNVAVAVATPSGPNHVRVGATIKAVFIEMWYISSASQPTFQVTTVQKIPSDGVDPTSAQMSDLHTWPNKKNILFTSQGLVGDANSNPIPIMRQWFKIPKGKQRMGLGDKIVVSIAARGETNNDIEVCGMNIYKEYY